MTETIIPDEFVALDFELANPSRGSIIQIGVQRVCDGELEESACLPVDLHPSLFRFAPRNMMIHGLGPDYIRGASGWDEILTRLVDFTDGGELPLVAHNADVERTAIEQACAAWGLVVPHFSYHCTQRAGRQILAGEYTGRMGLEELVAHEGLDTGFKHHDAGADAKVTAELVLSWSQRFSPHVMRTLWSGVGRLRDR